MDFHKNWINWFEGHGVAVLIHTILFNNSYLDPDESDLRSLSFDLSLRIWLQCDPNAGECSSFSGLFKVSWNLSCAHFPPDPVAASGFFFCFLLIGLLDLDLDNRIRDRLLFSPTLSISMPPTLTRFLSAVSKNRTIFENWLIEHEKHQF